MIRTATTIQKAAENLVMNTKSTPKIISQIPSPMFPAIKIVFLPKRFKAVIEPNVAAN
jgi:hypothetical protein